MRVIASTIHFSSNIKVASVEFNLVQCSREDGQSPIFVNVIPKLRFHCRRFALNGPNKLLSVAALLARTEYSSISIHFNDAELWLGRSRTLAVSAASF